MPIDPTTTANNVDEAAAMLRAGRAVIIPTETFFAVATDASSEEGLGAIREIARARTGSDPGALTWHAVSREQVMTVIAPASPLHRRVVERLLPGPFRLLVELDEPGAAGVRRALRVAGGVIDEGGVFAVRVPDHVAAHEVLERAAVTVIAIRADGAGFGDGRSLAPDDEKAARAAGIGAVVREGPAPSGRSSTTIRLTRDGGWQFVGGGAHDERYVRRKVERSVLLVCTGNTCRSPMAAAIMRHELATQPAPPAGRRAVPLRIESAGVAATEGVPMTAEAREALDGLKVDPGRHRSRALTREMISEAEAIFVMTASQLRAIQEFGPEAAAKARLVDPAGDDVPDPIGRDEEVYRDTAERLREMVRRRIRELQGPEGASE
ncbi:Low molecular weight protein-tyrosine-phosphatase Ptp [Phycisphaerales bacterium]|nr:Low molecular weight protein-tyrosine-phosphatase Ptp [Phycisphaerales bacterium]